MSVAPGARLGVLVPCRNEERVLSAKLANLAACRWPEGRDHRLVVIDNGSTDGTRELAERLLAEHFAERADVRAEVLDAPGGGKPAALLAGLSAIGSCELAVVTDADVRLDPEALLALDRAFAENPQLGLACGAQYFAESLAADGTLRASDGGDPEDALGLYDRVTAWVRRLESRSGRLFSVHGQLMAWRVSLGLQPRLGLAADDIALRQDARRRGARVELVPSAGFFEVKLPRSSELGDQAVRRAAAYFQVMRAIEPVPGSLDRLQYFGYRYLPEWAPVAVPLLALSAVLLVGWGVGWVAGLLVLAILTVGALSSPGRRLLELLSIMGRARRLERRQGLADGWEMARS